MINGSQWGRGLGGIVLLLCLLDQAVLAQPNPNEIGLYANPDGTGWFVPYFMFRTFSYYVVATPGPTGIKAWEASVSLPIGFFVTSVEFDHPRTFSIGDMFPSPTNGPNLIVGLGGGCAIEAQPRMLAKINAIAVTRTPIGPEMSCLEPSNPTSVNGSGPAYSDCLNQIAPFPLAQNGYPRPGCVQIGNYCGPTRPVRTFIDSESNAGDAGSLVLTPLNLYSPFPFDCPTAPQPLVYLRFDVQVDSTVAVLEDVDLTLLPSDWSLSITRPNSLAHVELQGSTPIYMQVGLITHAQLLFRMSDTPGTTTFEFLNFFAGDYAGVVQTSIGDVASDGPSVLTSMPVGVEEESFTAIKYRFRQ